MPRGGRIRRSWTSWRAPIERLQQRISELADAEGAFANAEQEARGLEETRQAAARAVEEQLATWVREKEYATTKRTELLTQYDDVKEQRDKIAELGPQGECPTCRRPLGAEHAAVLGVLDRQLQAIVEDGKYFRQRVDQLVMPAAAVVAAEAARDALRDESRRSSERAGELRARVEERARGAVDLETARRRAASVRRQIQTRRTGYDPARHDAVRANLLKLEPVALEAASLEERAARAGQLVSEAEMAEHTLTEAEQRVQQLANALAAEGFSDKEFRLAKEAYDRALGMLREAELALVAARGAAAAAEAVQAAARRRAERAERGARSGSRCAPTWRSIKSSTARSRPAHRSERHAAARDLPSSPPASCATSPTAATPSWSSMRTTAPRCSTTAIPKPVISGGEEDVANLGASPGDLPDDRRARRSAALAARSWTRSSGRSTTSAARPWWTCCGASRTAFPQVILITHIDSVREGFDRVIRVGFDAARGVAHGARRAARRPMRMWRPDRSAPRSRTGRRSATSTPLNRVFADAFTDRYSRDGLVGVRVPHLNPLVWRYALEDAGNGAMIWRDADGTDGRLQHAAPSGTEGWMGPLAVRPDRQGEGIGSTMVRLGIDWLQGPGRATIGLETMPRTVENIGFYSRIGFTPGPSRSP